MPEKLVLLENKYQQTLELQKKVDKLIKSKYDNQTFLKTKKEIENNEIYFD